MEETKNKGSEEARIQSLLEAFLRSRTTLKSSAAETSFHLDEDSLAAFAEGNLSERESEAMVNHLVRCGFCRHKTAELLRLSLEFEGITPEPAPLASEPSTISGVLSGLLAKIFGSASSENAVLAHGDEEAKDGEPGEKDEKDEKEQ